MWKQAVKLTQLCLAGSDEMVINFWRKQQVINKKWEGGPEDKNKQSEKKKVKMYLLEIQFITHQPTYADFSLHIMQSLQTT